MSFLSSVCRILVICGCGANLMSAAMAASLQEQLSSDVYTAATIQYAPDTLHSEPLPSPPEANRQMLKNLASLNTQIIDAQQHGAQILVLPEQGLSGFPFTDRRSVKPYLQTFGDDSYTSTPLCNASVADTTAKQLKTMADSEDPGKRDQAYRDFIELPSHRETEASPVLYKAACVARGLKLTFVVDIALKQHCSSGDSNCPSDGHYQFNTQVVYGTSGEVLSHYDKNHLYTGESKIFDEPPNRPTLKYFDTDFGVRFGQSICFDIFFHAPLVELHNEHGIDNFVFSTYWHNDGSYPLISATQIQQGVSQALDANFIASNVGYSYDHSGSGIYSRGKPLNTTFFMDDYYQPRLMMSQLPKSPASSGKEWLHDSSIPTISFLRKQQAQQRSGSAKSNDRSDSFKMTVFNVKQNTSGTVHSTNGNLTCSLDYALHSVGNQSYYALIALNGYYFDPLLPAQLCSVAVCPEEKCEGEKLPLPDFEGSKFSSFSLSGSFSYSPVLPMALTANGSVFDYTEAMNMSSSSREGYTEYKMCLRAGEIFDLTSTVLYATNMT